MGVRGAAAFITHMVLPLHSGDLASLVEVGCEAEAALGVLDDADDLAPSPQRLLRRVLGLHAPEVLLEVALHLRRGIRLPARAPPPPPPNLFVYTTPSTNPPPLPGGKGRVRVYIHARTRSQLRGARALTGKDVTTTLGVVVVEHIAGKLRRARARAGTEGRGAGARWFSGDPIRGGRRGREEGESDEKGWKGQGSRQSGEIPVVGHAESSP